MAETPENAVSHAQVRARRPRRSLGPNRPILVVEHDERRIIAPEEISRDRVGCKAFGLCCLPSEWVPPFFVVSASCLDEGGNMDKLARTIDDSVREVGVRSSSVLVRSSGTTETLQDRGRLQSTTCPVSEITGALHRLSQDLSTNEHPVHWIVQERIEPIQQGHLSNLRRVSREPRDWRIEVSPVGRDRGYGTSIGVRPWRDGTPQVFDLACRAARRVPQALRPVALWSLTLKERTLFEWVWNGTRVYIVQVDLDVQPGGVIPKSLLPNVVPSVNVPSLRVFRGANRDDYGRFGKLRNARVYMEIGYTMPNFYILDDVGVIHSVLNGVVDARLEHDLAELTSRPLIIRTDGLNIPDEKREMLPRSDGLLSFSDATTWLLGKFSADIAKAQLADSGLCLIAHHFIPSVASAWARAEPRNRLVRIESLWGVPEGLYWFSHDTFEVDTKRIDLPTNAQDFDECELRHFKLRHKGAFIAPGSDGRWVRWETAPPQDWGRSIRRDAWLKEIAHTTRRIAQHDQRPVSVMWFIDNHPQATPHTILPWYHSASMLTSVKAAPRRKRSGTSDATLRTVEDWEALQREVQGGKRFERIVVDPVDPGLIRNPAFLRELGALAATKHLVIEMAGGILSHAFYELQRAGAHVECVDLVGLEDETVEYHKLVRDRIPEIIKKRGEHAEVVELRDDALKKALRQKLVEEAFEALDAKTDDELISELVDVKEVMNALRRMLGISTARMEAERQEKVQRRGGFRKGIMLTKTATPHLSTQAASPAGLEICWEIPTIVAPDELPSNDLQRRPDLRRIGDKLEKLVTFQIDASKLEETVQVFEFTLPLDEDVETPFELAIELRRTRSAIRATARLRTPNAQPQDGTNSTQITLDFSSDT